MNLKGARPQAKQAANWLLQMFDVLLYQLGVILGLQLDSVADLAALGAVDDLRIPDGSKKVVRTLWDSFTLDKNSAAVADNITVVATSSGTGRWLRDLQPVTTLYSTQPAWFVNPTTGSDENDGATSGTALATFTELRRRVESVGINAYTVITIEEDLPADDLVKLQTKNQTELSFVGEGVLIQGEPTIEYTGTVAAYSKSAVANNPGTLNDAAWTVADHVGRYVLFTSGAATGFGCWIAEDLGGNNARVSTVLQESFIFTSEATPAPGDTFVVYSFPEITMGQMNMSGGLYMKYLENLADSMLVPTFADWWFNMVGCKSPIQNYCRMGIYTSCWIQQITVREGKLATINGGIVGGISQYGGELILDKDVTLDATVAGANNRGFYQNSHTYFYSDVYLFGAFARPYALEVNNGSILSIESERLRGDITGIASGLIIITSGTVHNTRFDHSIVEQTVRIGGVDVEINDGPLQDVATQAHLGLDTAGISGSIGPVKAGVKGAISNVDGTTYALSDLTSSATNVVPHVVGNRGILRNLHAYLGTAIGGDNVQVNVLVDSGAGPAATGLTVAMTGATQSFVDDTNNFVVEPGDRVSFQLVRTGGGATGGANLSLSIECG